MRTFFFSFLVFVMILSVYGWKLNKATGIISNIAALRQEFNTVVKNLNPDQDDPINLEQDQLQALLKKQTEAGKQEHFDPEVQKMLDQINKENIVAVNPLIQKLLDIGKEDKSHQAQVKNNNFDFKQYLYNIIITLQKQNNHFLKVFLTIAASILLIVLITRTNALSGIGLLLATLGFTLSRCLIFVSAILSVIAYLSFKLNIFINVGSVFLWGPLILLVLSAISLKIYDFNRPVWNKIFFSFVWPTISGVIIHVL